MGQIYWFITQLRLKTVQLDYARVPIIVMVGFCLCVALTASAAPSNVKNYTKISGGIVDIQDGAYVEGSLSMGGIQPDYFIDLNGEPLKSILNRCEEIKKLNLPYWDKVGMVIELVQTDFFKYTNYHNPYYRRLLKKYREASKDIPLSEYGVCQSGVCREHALVLHFALKAAGIENKHAYARIYRASKYHKYEVHEDHAFVILEKGKEKWVADAYYWGFNGFRLKDLMSPSGITENSPHAPIARPGLGTRRIEAINNFPVIYNPKRPIIRCSKVLTL